MADNILRLKVESSEYDAKLASAAKGIRHLADVAHKGGGDLTGLEKAELDYIKALGDMETKSRSASGQVRELSSTYKELKVVYDQLNEVEKADEGGKALAASLETLRTRAQEAKAQLDSATQSLNDNGEAGKGTSGILEVLKDKFTINIDALTLFNKGLQAAEVALNVAKDAFFASEATVDEWGRIVDSSKSLYEGFLTALNTGDISGYLGRIDEIVQAARTAYNELDRLGTMKTIQGPKMSAQQTENERMRMMIQTGRYIAPVDGRRASMKDGQLLTPEQIRGLETKLQNGMKTVVSLVGNEVKQTGKAIDAVYDRQAKELGLSLKEFRKGTSSMAEFDKRMAGYEQYQKWREQHTTIDIKSGRETVARGNPFEQFAKWGTFRVDGQRYNDLVKLIQQRDQQAGQAYSMQSQAYRTMNRAEGVTVSKLMRGETAGGATGGKGTTAKKEQTEMQQNQTRINDLTQQYVTLMASASEAGKPLTDEQQKQTSEIQRQISELEKRNGLLKLYQEQAQGRLLGNESFRQKLQVEVTANNQQIDALKTQLETLTDPKTVTVTAQTDEAAKKLEGLNAVRLSGKTFAVTLSDNDVTDKLNTIDGITIDPKTVTVTAQTEEALKKVEDLKRKIAELEDRNLMINAGMASLDLQNARDLSRTGGVTGFIGTGKSMMPIEGLPPMGDVVRQRGGNLLDEKAMKAVNEDIRRNLPKDNESDKRDDPLKEAKKQNQFLEGIGSGISGMLSGLEKMGIEIPEGLSSLIGGIQTITGIISSILTLVTVISALTSVKSTPIFGWLLAQGGIAGGLGGRRPIHAASGTVVGNTYSGDQIPAMLNAGEVVLNRAQAGNLASQLENGASQNLKLDAVITGEQIRLVLNNNGRRTGRGEYVQSTRRR